MLLPDLVVCSRRVVSPRGVVPAAVHVRSGRIIGVLDFDDRPEGCRLDDAGDLVVMPGLVDTSVRVDTFDDSRAFERMTRSAAAGGVTTIVDLGSPRHPIDSLAALDRKRRAAEGHIAVDIGFAGAVTPGKESELARLAEAGVVGFRSSMTSELRDAMPALTRLGATLLVDGAPAVTARPRILKGGVASPWRYAKFLAQHPSSAETDAIVRVLDLCREHRTRTHIVDLAASDALTPIFRARAAGLPVSIGTYPHYLFFASEELPAHARRFRDVPPIRNRVNRELLWGAVSGGLIQTIGSGDGSSHVTSVQHSLAAAWTVASARGHDVERLTLWMSGAPAKVSGLDKKGRIDVGYDADLVVWDPDASFASDDRSAYADRSLRGVVRRVYLRGAVVFESGKRTDELPGSVLTKAPHPRAVAR